MAKQDQMGSKERKAQCLASFNRGQERKARRRAENERRHAINVERGYTEHQLKKRERTERRAMARAA